MSARSTENAVAAAQQDVRTVSVDEMTGVQALEGAAPDLPMRSGDSSVTSSNTSATAHKA